MLLRHSLWELDSELVALEECVPKRDYQKELGEAIQALRKERGLKQQDLATAAGVSVAQVSNVESGQFWPSVQALIAFAEKLGVRVGDIFAFELGPDDRARAAERAKLLALTNRLSHEELTWAIEVLMAAVKRPVQAPSKSRARFKGD